MAGMVKKIQRAWRARRPLSGSGWGGVAGALGGDACLGAEGDAAAMRGGREGQEGAGGRRRARGRRGEGVVGAGVGEVGDDEEGGDGACSCSCSEGCSCSCSCSEEEGEAGEGGEDDVEVLLGSEEEVVEFC